MNTIGRKRPLAPRREPDVAANTKANPPQSPRCGDIEGRSTCPTDAVSLLPVRQSDCSRRPARILAAEVADHTTLDAASRIPVAIAPMASAPKGVT